MILLVSISHQHPAWRKLDMIPNDGWPCTLHKTRRCSAHHRSAESPIGNDFAPENAGMAEAAAETVSCANMSDHDPLFVTSVNGHHHHAHNPHPMLGLFFLSTTVAS